MNTHTPQRFLSLDLDFFLDQIKLWSGEGRLDPAEYHPWAEDAVRAFLEERCGLSTTHPTPGIVATHHDALLHHWHCEVTAGRLVPPFHVVHVDAHADLGLGDEGFLEIMGELLFLPVEDRPAAAKGVEEGNFLSYAAAYRWLASLEYVTHPQWGKRDLNFMHFYDYDDRSGWLELKAVEPNLLRRKVAAYNCYPRPFIAEPKIPFRNIPSTDWKTEEVFDVVFVCQSPEYTPPTADALMAVIGEYLVV